LPPFRFPPLCEGNRAWHTRSVLLQEGFSIARVLVKFDLAIGIRLTYRERIALLPVETSMRGTIHPVAMRHEGPSSLFAPSGWVEREAKLLEAGVYPERGLVLTLEDMERLVAHFRSPVPLFVEHRPSPVQLGWLVAVWQRGMELFGRLWLLPEADALLQRLRVRGLSLGLSRDLQHIVEVSVTGSPRVPDARLFCASMLSPLEVNRMEPMPEASEVLDEVQQLRARVRQLERELQGQQVREQVQRWTLSGKLPPALASLAEAILMQGEAPVQFSGETLPIAELFRRFVDALPAQSLLGEIAPMPAYETPHLSHEELQFLQQAFPDLNPSEVLANRDSVEPAFGR
jgi:hypothetical protein